MALDGLADATPRDLDENSPTIIWDDLRSHSLQPGGFGRSRVEIWPQLLGVPISTVAKKPVGDEVEAAEAAAEHPDERQIRLDTDRSFVLYPVGPQSVDKEEMKEKLNHLLVSIFRKRPKLNYFQGYHDIVSVIFLTLPEEMQLLCAEKISLHRVRDSMGSTLEPILGLLRVTNNLLRLADPNYAQDLERASPLPFYALSNLLTLFSHDMPTLPLIQHVFDYILCRPPIAIVYLATAIILSRKHEIRRLEEEDEDEGMGMAHSLLSGLPPITNEEEPVEEDTKEWQSEEVKTLVPNEEAELRVKQEEQNLLPDIPLAVKTEEQEVTLKAESEPSPENGLESTKEEPPIPNSNSAPPTIHPAPSPPPLRRSHQPASITLTSLLMHADALYTLYPPTHPSLALSSIMGPQSVVYTWSEAFSALPTDDEAEAMVARPGLVVYPYIEEDDDAADDGLGGEARGAEEAWDEKAGRKKRAKGKLRGRVKGKLKRMRVHRRLGMERRTGTMVAGAVLVVGVAMAVYGVKMRGMHPGEMHGRDWRKAAGWVGGVLAGATERVVSGLSPSAPGSGH